MRVGVVANLLDRLLIASGRVPVPILDTFPTLVLARAIMAATRLGLFEALRDGPLSSSVIAARCSCDPRATTKLLGVLVSSGYLRVAGASFALTALARRWLLAESPVSVRDYLLYNYDQWDWLERLEGFTQTGEPLQFHDEMTCEGWARYQEGMRVIARLTAPEVALRLPMPRGARTMLDIGGSHGLYAAALCRRYPELKATILDLPEMAEQAEPRLAELGLGPRVGYAVGDARTADLGEQRYDLVFVANLVHHFDAATNRQLACRIARALRPGGMFVIQDGILPARPGRGGQFAALGDLYFALSSESGIWSSDEMARWQREAGLRPRRAISLVTAPGQGFQPAIKRR